MVLWIDLERDAQICMISGLLWTSNWKCLRKKSTIAAVSIAVIAFILP